MAFTDPSKNIAELHVREGMIAVDFGAGTGEHAIELGKKVGERGRVYAVEVQKNLLQNIKTAARESGLANIDVIWGDIEIPHGVKLADESADVVIMTNTFFLVEDKVQAAREAFRILKPGGRAMVIDWSDSFGGLGPLQDDVVTETTAHKILESVGFVFERRFVAGDHHYGIIVVRQ